MEIVYAAEAPTIAEMLSEHIQTPVHPAEINVSQNPDETGSYFIGYRRSSYRLTPAGRIIAEGLRVVRRAR